MMRSRNTFRYLLFVAIANALPFSVAAFDITGGRVWDNRVGPGLSFSVGFNTCLDEYCDDVWDTSASIGDDIGFYYQIIPNAAVYVDIHTGHIRMDMDTMNDDSAFLFETNAGGEFQVPITGWVAPYFGFGMGFIYLGAWADVDWPGADNQSFHHALFGFNFDLKFGANFYPFSRVPTLGVGPLFRFGLPVWINACGEFGGRDECDAPDELQVGTYSMRIDDDDDPAVFYFALAARYGF